MLGSNYIWLISWIACSNFQVLTSISLDSAIRVAAQWYQSHLGGAARILLITNDKENKRKAIAEGISAETSKISFAVVLASNHWV